MKAEEFFSKVVESLEKTNGSDPTGCWYFIGDMEDLFTEWENNEEVE